MATPASSIFLTLLPNGVADGASARVSVLVTPSLADNTPVQGTLFADWPSTAAKLLGGLNQINCLVAGSTRAVRATLDPQQRTTFDCEMWSKILGANLATTTARKPADVANANLAKWRISHDAAALHYIHQRHRQERVNAELLSNVNDRARIDPVFQAFLKRLNRQQSVINLYLHPFRQPSPTDPGNPQGTSMDALLARRQDALRFCANEATNPNYNAGFTVLLGARVTHALKLLQQGDEQLLDIGIYAVQLSCAASLSFNYAADSASAINAVVTKALAPSTPGANDAINANALDQAQRYVEFLLFSRRTRGMVKRANDDPLPAPDFHQLLGLLHRSPALLRPLGLVFDLVFQVPIGTTVISITPPSLSNVPQGIELFTQCTVATDSSPTHSLIDFFATPQASGVQLIYKRFVNLQARDSMSAPMFSLISQDSEGDIHKRVQASIADSHAVEYISEANTAPTTSTPERPSAVTLKKLPSVRTAGITLLHSQRLDRLQAALKRASAPDLGHSTNPFFADDLVLGYRVDVRCNAMSADWYHLGKRSSRYYMLDSNGQPTNKVFIPQTDVEKHVDEGFISPAATSTDPQNGESQIQVHQALFTWSGWGIGFPSLFQAMNEQCACSPSGTNQHLRVKPQYEHDGNLLPLRFGRSYDVRCRIVDVAGNSVQPADTDQSDDGFVVLSVAMHRHEAIRSPQVLLTEPLNSRSAPGAQSDRLVVRDHSGDTTRAVVPPRETLRLAELHGILRDPRVPPSAFPGIRREDDGSFPQVDPEATSAQGSDAIFKADKSAPEPTLPYYPDPLATFLRVNLLSYSVPDNLSLDPLREKIKNPLPFYPSTQRGDWPFCSPCRIRLSAGKPGTGISAELRSVPKDDNGDISDLVQGLLITLPPAVTVTLNLSSASVTLDPSLDASANQQRTAQSATALIGRNAPVMAMQVPTIDFIAHPQQPPHIVATFAAGPAGPGIFELVPGPRQAAAPEDAGVAQALTALASSLAMTGVDPNQFLLNGNFPSLTPPHPITLVHAVKKPLIDAAPAGTFVMKRALGQTAAQLYADLGPEDLWYSASKIVCHATWTDKIDNLQKSDTGTIDVRSSELVFELSEAQSIILNQTKGTPQPQNTLFHHLRDTRAHKITYQLSATSRFRDYYPADAHESDFIRESAPLVDISVRSSVRPPAPSVCYLIPAFEWRENNDPKCKGWVRQRLHVIRVYHERPFRVSGDLEQLGVLLAPNAHAQDEAYPGAPYVSRVAMDPIHRVGAAEAIPNQMTPDQLTGYAFTPSCQLTELTAPIMVDVAAYDVKWAEKRQLWYCDIATNFCRQYAPFVRLALVRYQAESLGSISGEPEARISPVVFAEFAQTAPNRFASVQVKGKAVTLTVSGDSYDSRLGLPPNYPNTSFDNEISVTLQNRWHHLTPDMAWKPCACNIPQPDFKVIDGVCTWTFTFTLPHHPSLFKYRLQIEETETLYEDDPGIRTPTSTPRTATAMLAVLPVETARTTYFDFLEL